MLQLKPSKQFSKNNSQKKTTVQSVIESLIKQFGCNMIIDYIPIKFVRNVRVKYKNHYQGKNLFKKLRPHVYATYEITVTFVSYRNVEPETVVIGTLEGESNVQKFILQYLAC